MSCPTVHFWVSSQANSKPPKYSQVNQEACISITNCSRNCPHLSDQVSPPHTGKAWRGEHHQPFPTIITLQSEQHWRRAWELTIATAVGPGLSHSPPSSCHWALAPHSGQMCAYNAPPSSEGHLQVHTHSARPRTDNQCLCRPATCTPPHQLASNSHFPKNVMFFILKASNSP